MTPIIDRILVKLVIIAFISFVVLVLIGLWDRYEKEAAALGFSGPYERYLASRVGFPSDPQGYRAAAQIVRWPHRPQTAAIEE
jgi:hypothetical protein